jgi:hypothetical protein
MYKSEFLFEQRGKKGKTFLDLTDYFVLERYKQDKSCKIRTWNFR